MPSGEVLVSFAQIYPGRIFYLSVLPENTAGSDELFRTKMKYAECFLMKLCSVFAYSYVLVVESAFF